MPYSGLRQLLICALGLILSQGLAAQTAPNLLQRGAETLTRAEHMLWQATKAPGVIQLKKQRFKASKTAETSFYMRFDGKANQKTLHVYYFIPGKWLIRNFPPNVALIGPENVSTNLTKYVSVQDGTIIYGIFPLELPNKPYTDVVRFKASVPGKLIAFL
ncbi:hypothetical protein ACO2Q8_14705 [Larkinella sp. VNQ87]|uniref:hypothetical protein n=1 Tax=Larkinella sp. VNQ87 TaxID=3400921 RepID=UPI003C0C96CD